MANIKPNAYKGYGGHSLDSSEKAKVVDFMTGALDTASQTGFQLTRNVYVYTPDPTSDSQEVLGVPEASSLAFLAFFGLIGALFFVPFARWRCALSCGVTK